MSQRKKTPDILGDLLGSKPILTEPAEAVEPPKQQSVLPVKHQNSETLRQQEDMPSNHQNELPVQQQNGKPSNRQNGLTAKPQSSKTSSQQAVLPVKRQNIKPVEVAEPEEDAGTESAEVEAKTKMTFYLSEDSVELLEEAQRKLRRMAKKTGKIQPKGITSKSALLEEALKLACDDLEAKGDQSRFASLIA